MSEASNVARLLGSPSTFLFEDVEYKIASPTRQDIKADLQRYFERGVREAIRRARRDLPKPGEANFQAELAEFEDYQQRQERLLAASYWSFGEEGYQRAATQGNGFAEQVWLCLKAHQPDFARETLGRMLRDSDTVLTILSIFSAYVKAENDQRQGAAGGGTAGPKE